MHQGPWTLPCHIELCIDDMNSSSSARDSLDIEPSTLPLLPSMDSMLMSLVRCRRCSGRDGVSIANEISGDCMIPGVMIVLAATV